VAKKQIIGCILILFAILEMLAIEMQRSMYKCGVYGFTEEIFHFLTGVFVFLAVLAAGAVVFRGQKRGYWSISWGITSIIVGILALWTFILSENPTESEWGGLAQSTIYYAIGSLQGQTAVSLAVLALCTSRRLRSRFLLMFAFSCLFLSSVIMLIYIGRLILISISIGSISGTTFRGFLSLILCNLFNIVPLGVVVSLILFILKEKTLKQPEI
jgi:hypothetical protein